MDYLQEYYDGKLTEEDLDDMFGEPHAINWSAKKHIMHSQERMPCP